MNKNIELKQKENCSEVKIHFLGGIITHAIDLDDVNDAIEEAILCFIQASKECGKGLFKELNYDNT